MSDGSPFMHRHFSTADDNATVIKASSGKLTGLQLINKNTSVAAWFKLYNKASAPANTDTPVKTLVIPAAAAAAQPTVVFANWEFMRMFGVGISYRITGAAADNDNTAIGANDVIVNADYV